MELVPELLAPAGDWRGLKAALGAGADAVYFGVKGFNMRASARNFEVKDLRRVTSACKKAEAKAYLALNILVFQKELSAMQRLLNSAAKAGVDGVIASDLGVMCAARDLGLEVHASTQLSVSNAQAFEALRSLGVSRVVLARECSLEDIAKIVRASKGEAKRGKQGLEIEVFAHGAMCVSESGRCFLSEFSLGKSANRGACAQPCRREYKIVEEREGQEWTLGKNYLLSPQDLCTLPFIEKLIEAGAHALKIEGRMRGPEYVSTVVGVYRRALDYYLVNSENPGFKKEFKELKTRLLRELATVYNRGFSPGFYHGRPTAQWAETAGSVATKRKRLVGRVLNFYRKPSVAQLEVLDEGFAPGEELLFEGPTTGFVKQIVFSLRNDAGDLAKAAKGDKPTLQVGSPVRPGDKVYIMR